MTDREIFCFQHCDRSANILCLKLPPKCPICGCDNLTDAELRVPPFKIPSPFQSAAASPCSVVIKPSRGDFLNSYGGAMDLHAGITNSKGVVYEYDVHGLVSNDGDNIGQGSEWSHCVSVPVLGTDLERYAEFWDYTLDALISVQERDKNPEDYPWSAERYDAQTYNCYTFVMRFLRLLQLPHLRPSLADKTAFCADFIVPRTKNAARYIVLYRKLKAEGVYVKRVPAIPSCPTTNGASNNTIYNTNNVYSAIASNTGTTTATMGSVTSAMRHGGDVPIRDINDSSDNGGNNWKDCDDGVYNGNYYSRASS